MCRTLWTPCIIFFHRWKLQEKSTFLYTDFLYPPDNVLLCKAMLVRYQLLHWYTKKNFFWVVSDLWIDFECFEAAELKNELSFSLPRQRFFAISQLYFKNGKKAIQTLKLPLLNDCHSNENNFNTLNAMPRSWTCSFLRRLLHHVPERRAALCVDRQATFQNV